MTAAAKSGRKAKRKAAPKVAAKIVFHLWQVPVFDDRESGVSLLLWSRQIGKSFVLACWAVDRCLSRPGRLVTVLSNSKDNGAEFNATVGKILKLVGEAAEEVEQTDLSPDIEYQNMHYDTRIRVGGKTSRIKVLAANPRTARGFSGDLILDEFAFHEDGAAIWEAAEPILASNPDFLCRIASTLNGKRNMFWTLIESGLYPVNTVRRSDAYKLGLKIYSLGETRREITPAEARAAAVDKKAYDQNYECIAGDETTVLLTHALIDAATDNEAGVICSGQWSEEALERIAAATGPLYLGGDIGRTRDLTKFAVGEEVGSTIVVRAWLTLEGVRLPDQQAALSVPLGRRNFRRACVDMTGIGLGLVEYSQDEFGFARVVGVNFSSTVPISRRLLGTGRRGRGAAQTVPITEHMATELLGRHEDGTIRYPCDLACKDDLRKPERQVSPSGRVSIAATRDAAGHADGFWSLALLCRAVSGQPAPLPPRRFGDGRPTAGRDDRGGGSSLTRSVARRIRSAVG